MLLILTSDKPYLWYWQFDISFPQRRELVFGGIPAVCPFYYSHYRPLCICSRRQVEKQIKRKGPASTVHLDTNVIKRTPNQKFRNKNQFFNICVVVQWTTEHPMVHSGPAPYFFRSVWGFGSNPQTVIWCRPVPGQSLPSPLSRLTKFPKDNPGHRLHLFHHHIQHQRCHKTS